jgi:hypothetical protein
MKIFIVFLLAFLGVVVSASPRIATPTPNVPKVELEFWNGEHRLGYNCYNYATNRATDTFAQPGESGGVYYGDLECQEITKAVGADSGILQTEFFPMATKRDETLIALVVAPGYDYHWYRRGDDGMWTHKMGGTRATNKDQSGEEISDPTKADRGDYTDFCGYFKVTNYQYDRSEQNGGYVKIGGMRHYPKLPGEDDLVSPKVKLESTVVVDMYSGRPNPSLLLREVLANRNLSKMLTTQVKKCAAQVMGEPSESPQLGYRGVGFFFY